MNLPRDNGRLARKPALTAICELIAQQMWKPRRLTTLWASTAWYRDSFTFLLTTFLSQGCLHNSWRSPVRRADGLYLLLFPFKSELRALLSIWVKSGVEPTPFT
jgi:hypothetical protein